MDKDFNLRNVVWISMILISAGSVYGMMSQKVSALETKMDRLEQILFQDIPEIKEQLVRLDAKISYLVEDKEAN
jgi:MFS-type transporter involved in bile tolerance (Atg22 family)|tara:strand:+ start:305 stop:526 length:222 start_codon:yes stop_codon:yes gene_type:complete